MIDLFGQEHPDPAPRNPLGTKPAQLDLMTHAAETAAMRTGRALSQERAILLAPRPDAELQRLCPTHKTPLLLEHGGGFSCPRCG